MDQAQNADFKVAQLISRLTKEVTDLRDENAQLRNQLASTSGGKEDADDDVSRNRDDLLEEIAELKVELQERPSQEEVDILQKKILKYKGRKREWEGSVNYLSNELDTAISTAEEQEELSDRLEREIEKLQKDLKDMAREKQEAIARLESQQQGKFGIAGGKRPTEQQNQGQAEGSSKRRRLKS